MNLGQAYKMKGELRTALTAFDAGLELDPNHISLCCHRAIVLYRMGRRREADTDLAYAGGAIPE